ncbi:MAG TPA: 5-deoxy-glucuronate isomerase [Jatrophihabitans sp.]|nr:5-deoxy-glucuronate isomerase [Jatrophihabitans sp.]
MTQTLISPGKGTELIRLDIARLDAGESEMVVRDDEEIFAVVLTGVVACSVDDQQFGRVGGRSSVFDGPGHAVYAPPGARVAITAVDGPVEVAVCSAPLAEGGEPAGARVVRPYDQRIAEVGEGNWARTVRTMLGPEHPAGRLIVGETINPAGNWSSYPPHKHDTDEPPREVKLEEVYHYRFDPAQGFGVQIRYNTAREECFIVRDGDTAPIPDGYHPVVAAPGYRMYYLWVMAGEGRQMAPYLDPQHAWVQTG